MKKTVLFIPLLLSICIAKGTVHYVDIDAAGTNDGTSWSNAFNDPQTAFNGATAGDTIWISEGTYFPSEDFNGNINPSDPKTKLFHIQGKNLKIYGGFDGTETMMSQRDWENHQVIFSGDIGTPGLDTDNALTVLLLQNLNDSTTIDGVTVERSYSFGLQEGGFMGQNLYGVHIRNCTIAHHVSQGNGSSYLGSCDVYFTNCIFHNNSANEGGTFYASNANLRIDQCEFHHNTSSAHSGNITFNGGGPGLNIPHTVITNSLFHNNTAGNIAAGALFFYNVPAGAAIYNCTFYNNEAPNGASIGSNGVSIDIENSIFWGSSANNEIFESNGNPAIIDVQNSTVEGGYATGTNVLTGNPNLVDPANFDFNLMGNSPAINAGDTLGISQYLGLEDFHGDSRYVSTIDQGCVEFNSVGIEDRITATMKIYPNPTQDILSVYLSHIKGNFKLEIKSTDGKTILQPQPNQNIDVSVLPDGLYFVQLIFSDGEILNAPFIKQ